MESLPDWGCFKRFFNENKTPALGVGYAIIAFVKERFHNAVEIDILGIFEGYSSLQIWPPKTFFRGEIIQSEWRNFHQARALYLTEVLTCVLVCFLVEFDLLFAFVVLSCLILDSASLFIYVHEHDRLCFPMSETAVFYCICWLSSSRDRKGQSYPVEYCLESVEEYSEGTIRKGQPEPRNGNVNTVYFINQARGNTRISPTEFIYEACDCKWLLIFELPA